MANNNLDVSGTLSVSFRDGKYGKFPTATLVSELGTFACRDKWLESLDEGNYEGLFSISFLELRSYMTTRGVPEARTYIKATISSFQFDNHKVDPTAHIEFESLGDPIEEDSNEENAEASEESAFIDINSTINMEQSINQLFENNGLEINWSFGDDIVIPAEFSRQHQRLIRNYLTHNNYYVADARKRLWSLKEEASV